MPKTWGWGRGLHRWGPYPPRWSSYTHTMFHVKHSQMCCLMFHVKQLMNKCNFYTIKLQTAFICVLSDFSIFKHISYHKNNLMRLKRLYNALFGIIQFYQYTHIQETYLISAYNILYNNIYAHIYTSAHKRKSANAVAKVLTNLSKMPKIKPKC